MKKINHYLYPALLSILSMSSEAAMITGTFTGMITDHSDYSGTITGTQHMPTYGISPLAGSVITGTVWMDTTIPMDQYADRDRMALYKGSPINWLSIQINGFHTPTPVGFTETQDDAAELRQAVSGDLYNLQDLGRYQNNDYYRSTHLYITGESLNRFLNSDHPDQTFDWAAGDGDGSGILDFTYQAPWEKTHVTANLLSLNLSAVPIPASFPLMLSGLVGIAVVARRRRIQ